MIATMKNVKVTSLKPESKGSLTIDNVLNPLSNSITQSDKVRLAVLKIRGSIIAIK